MSSKITDLEDARAMREMGLPVITEVKHGGQLPERCERLIKDVLKAARSVPGSGVCLPHQTKSQQL